MGTVSTTSVLRVINERAAYEQIRLLGPVSRPQVADATGLSKPTISLALANLEKTGLIRMVGQRTGGAGRSALLYEIRPEAGWVVGIDVGRSWIRAALANLAGEVVVRLDAPSRGRSATTLVDQLGALVYELAGEVGLSIGDITFIVLGMPGVYDRVDRRLLLVPNLPGWNRPGVIGRLAERLPAAFTIENDIGLAALGEQAYGLGEDVANFVFVSIDTGIGMGIIVDGRLYRGARGAAGEISFLPFGETDPLARESSARRRGTLEAVASAPGVVATARRLGMPGRITAKRVFDAARAADPIARRAVAVEAGHVARALAGIIAVLDPGLVVLGGGIGVYGSEVLLGAVRDQLRSLTPLGPPRLDVSALGDEAVVLGALATGLSTARDLVFNRAIATAVNLPPESLDGRLRPGNETPVRQVRRAD